MEKGLENVHHWFKAWIYLRLLGKSMHDHLQIFFGKKLNKHISLEHKCASRPVYRYCQL